MREHARHARCILQRANGRASARKEIQWPKEKKVVLKMQAVYKVDQAKIDAQPDATSDPVWNSQMDLIDNYLHSLIFGHPALTVYKFRTELFYAFNVTADTAHLFTDVISAFAYRMESPWLG